MRTAQWLMAIQVLFLAVIATSCSSIPSNTPKLVGLTNERIENHTVAVTAAFQMVLDEANFARQDIATVRDSLVTLRTAMELSDEQSRVIDFAISELTRLAQDLEFEQNIQDMPRNTDRKMGEVVAGLRLVQEIVGAEVDKRQLIEDMIGVLNRTGGESK